MVEKVRYKFTETGGIYLPPITSSRTSLRSSLALLQPHNLMSITPYTIKMSSQNLSLGEWVKQINNAIFYQPEDEVALKALNEDLDPGLVVK